MPSHPRIVLGASRSRRVAAQTLTRLCAMRIGFANGAHSGRRRNGVPSCPSRSRSSSRPMSCSLKSRTSSSPCAKPAAPARKPRCAAWPPCSVACSTTSAIGWCRWRSKPRDRHPGAGRSRARVIAPAWRPPTRRIQKIWHLPPDCAQPPSRPAIGNLGSRTAIDGAFFVIDSPSTGIDAPRRGIAEPSSGSVGPSTADVAPTWGMHDPSSGNAGRATGNVGASRLARAPSHAQRWRFSRHRCPFDRQRWPREGQRRPSDRQRCTGLGQRRPFDRQRCPCGGQGRRLGHRPGHLFA